MPWGDEWDRLMERRNRARVVLTTGYAMGAALAASMAAAAASAQIVRDVKHPRFRDKLAPSSPKPRIRKGR